MVKKYIKSLRNHIIVVRSGAKNCSKNVKNYQNPIEICQINIYNKNRKENAITMDVCNFSIGIFNSISAKKLPLDLSPMAGTENGGVFCFHLSNVKKSKRNKLSVQEKQKKWTSKAAGYNNEPVKESRKRMANVRDVANHFIKLYYYDNRKCTSASVQKLMVIAQLRYLYVHKIPIFENNLLIKPLCFSVPLISNTYPDVIFDDDKMKPLENNFEDGLIINIPNLTVEKEELSSFYNIIYDLCENETEILNLVYRHFGAYSGECIGKFMRELSLHKNNTDRLFKEITNEELLDYISNIPETDRTNPIIKFVCRNE